ncbi:MAG: restriction endonuclease subunit S [Gemmatimonadaceae bacterium]|nr:restriction endonuclease subunit S [Gemmatimonadaceae bacterium]
MGGEWVTVQLGEVTDLLTGFPFKSERYVKDPSAPRLLRGDNVAQGVLRWDGAKRWPRNAENGIEPYWLREGDVIVAMDRPWIEAGLKYAAVRRSDLPALLVQRVARLRGSSRLDTGFLKYVIGSRAFTDHVLGIQTGTAVPHISGGQIKSFEFLLPPLAEQRAIAHILGTLDDKVELNQRMSETLESMARALFTSWFVDFDPVCAKAEGRDPGIPSDLADLFPSRLVDSELGEIPEGWDVKSLDQVARFLNGLALQKYPPVDGRSLPVIKIAQLRAGNTVGADRASADLPDDYVVNDGDILFSWSGSLECRIWAGGRGALNQHLFKVTSSQYPRWLCYLGIHHHLDDFRRIAAGKATTMGHIQRHHLSDAKLAVPSPAEMRAMDLVIEPIVERTWRLTVESRTLAALRDTLLPRLISGELRIPDAERYVEGVA